MRANTRIAGDFRWRTSWATISSHRDGMPEEPITIDNPPSDDLGAATKSPAEIEADLFAANCSYLWKC